MIDLAWCGGLSEARKIANMAEASELPVTLHDCTGPIVYAASCALVGDAAECLLAGGGAGLLFRLVPRDRRGPARGADGRVTPLDGPGLGLTLRPELFERPDAVVRRTEA